MWYGRKRAGVAIVVLAGIAATVLAGDGFGFKCADSQCGHKPTIVFGGGKMFEAVTGYCHRCQKVQTVTWTREGALLVDKVVAPPKPLAEVWNPATGQVRRVFRCPGCEGGFMEIRSPAEITHCPKCAKEGFAVDPDAPRLAVD